MHPILYTLFSNLKRINGIGEKRANDFVKLGINSFKDLLYHLPYSLIDRSYSPPIYELRDGCIATLELTVMEHYPAPPNKFAKKPYKVKCANDTGFVNLVYFHANPKYLKANLPVSKKIAVSGKISVNVGSIDIIHPDIVVHAEKIAQVLKTEPVYHTTQGLSSRIIMNAINSAHFLIPNLPEWIDESVLRNFNWESWLQCIKGCHEPRTEQDLHPASKNRQRLAYDELLAHQVSLRLVRESIDSQRKEPSLFTGKLVERLISNLPFALTSDQKKVIEEISADQKSDRRGFRLLQGDVGCGKTLVAMCAILNAVESGKQGALMVPTEILALQHTATFKKYLESIGIRVECLISALRLSDKAKLQEQIALGAVDVVIGTHALFQEKVVYKNLGIVIVDEQHRFGVDQRLTLLNKGGPNCDFMMMTATPIPRTLAMIGYGDMDISVVREKPKCRQDIETKILSYSKLEELVISLENIMAKGEKIFWVCPLVEESEKLDLIPAVERHKYISRFYPEKVGLVHGQMASLQRDTVMQEFIKGGYNILVATTVIEVGVDVPDATVIVIENAEHFGLSQLHQLRGRVGRGDKKSFCILLSKSYHSNAIYERLKVIKENTDGFIIAEKDLEIRGSGDILGVKQSGMPEFKVFNPTFHSSFIGEAARQAKEIVKGVTNPQELNPNIRILLGLFDKDVTNPSKLA